MQLHAYLIRNQVLHVIKNHVHLTVAILSGKKNEVVRQCYVLLMHLSIVGPTIPLWGSGWGRVGDLIKQVIKYPTIWAG